MTSYVVLLPGDEAAWEATPQEQKQEMYAVHAAFAQRRDIRRSPITPRKQLFSGCSMRRSEQASGSRKALPCIRRQR